MVTVGFFFATSHYTRMLTQFFADLELGTPLPGTTASDLVSSGDVSSEGSIAGLDDIESKQCKVVDSRLEFEEDVCNQPNTIDSGETVVTQLRT